MRYIFPGLSDSSPCSFPVLATGLSSPGLSLNLMPGEPDAWRGELAC